MQAAGVEQLRTITPAPTGLRDAMLLALRAGSDGHLDRAERLLELAREIRDTLAQAPLPQDARAEESATRDAVLAALDAALADLLRQ